ncbi:AAA family ATPase [Catellatospora sp. TT07R-123]|uniref:AAA family ATPase n=1 Tax=Catellatospora sp. TT07R-123 TaxID=2733863 RepID=UPI001BB39EEE|nr:AAA family ATPase [Catellatospora sp. TT07R-123]
MGGRLIDEVTVSGFTSIRQATVTLTRLNVLIGANGAGKSNFLRVLELFSRLAEGRFSEAVASGGGASALTRRDMKRPSLTARADATSYGASFGKTADDRLVIEDERLVDRKGPSVLPVNAHEATALLSDDRSVWLREALAGCRVFHFNNTGRDAQVRMPVPTADNLAISPDGGNLAAVLWSLRQLDKAAYGRVVDAVRLVAPFFQDFVLQPDTRNDLIRLRWREVGSDAVYGVHQMSDGTLRFVCLATLLLHPAVPRLVVLDEPELGMHPFAVAQFVDLIRGLPDDRQVVIATQSIALLEQFALTDVVVVDRERGASVFHRPEAAKLSSWLEEYTLGELWQSNLIGGRPMRENP